jgi:hypothetical protein
MSELWGISCYFNPVGYQRRLQNYQVFRERLAIPLITVELAYRDGFDLSDDAAETVIRLRSRDVLWQKERLLNLALAALPASCSAVAWLDCDVVFEDDDWALRAAQALQRFPLLQPFDSVREMSAGGPQDSTGGEAGTARGHSLAYVFAQGAVTSESLRGNMRVKQRRNGGLAWVARRELLERDGFYDACVMGSGNRAMLCAALGMSDDAIHYLQMTQAWAEHYRPWAAKHFESVGGRIGYIEGRLTHLWHGDLQHRRYQERHVEFRAFQFDPARDIALDENRCWRWASAKTEMHDYVARYFRERREDGE